MPLVLKPWITQLCLHGLQELELDEVRAHLAYTERVVTLTWKNLKL